MSFTMDLINKPGEPMLMIDVECLGVKPTAPLAALAAVLFIPDTGEIISEFYKKIDFETSVAAGAIIEPDTVKFWLKQETIAQLEIVGSWREGTAEDISEVFRAFGEFIQTNTPAPNRTKYWANGANFDPVILEAAYARMDKRSPLAFWKSLDVRTIVELGRQIGMDPKTEAVKLGTPHKALEDCRLQVGYTSEIWKTVLAPHARGNYPTFNKR